jgi:DNA-binding NtrC family response regulator
MTSSRPEILIVEDEKLFASAVKRHVERAGYHGHVCASLAEARETLAAGELPAVILLDMRLPDGSGMDLLESLFDPDGPGEGDPPPVLVMTAFGGLDDAVAAMKLGAADYLKKPVDLDELMLNVGRVLEQRRVSRQLDYSRSRERGRPQGDGGGYLGESEAAAALREQIAAIAALGKAEAPPNVLMLGETGTGKGLIARLLHEQSARRDRPFVHVDCTALPADLVESELFGHRRGAFTGATADRTGLIEAAEDGTVFLDEIGELPLETQAKLLAVLERRLVRRVGSSSEIAVGAWFVAATNRDLEAEVAEGRFRSDLYYRLKVLTLESPSLRERPDDILLLAEHFAAATAQRFGLPVPPFDEPAREALVRYHWPGNVRELGHVIERGVLLGGGRALGAAQLFGTGAPARGTGPGGGAREETASAPAARTDAADGAGRDLAGLTLADAERLLIEDALERTAGNVSQAARELGVTRMTLRYRMKQHGLDRPGGS